MFILLVLCFTCACGQAEKFLSIPTFINNRNENDTSLWFKWKQQLAREINLKDLKTSTDTFHFRLWTDIQTVDIWTVDYSQFFGAVTNYAQRYDDKLLKKGVYKIAKIHSSQLSLDSSKARQIFKMIDTLSILSIATDNKISGWQQGFDGEEFLIETSSPKQYAFKEYWTPRIFINSVKEAKQIQAFIDYLYSDIKLFNYYQKLKLPKGSYQRNGVQGIKIN